MSVRTCQRRSPRGEIVAAIGAARWRIRTDARKGSLGIRGAMNDACSMVIACF